jgi:sugar/nucleoside kinase (ribokinase family)
MLCVVGDLVEDVVVWPSGPPRPGTDTPARIFRRRGGSAANVAVWAVRAGVPARFIGRVGADPLGAQLVAQLERDGVDVRVQRQGYSGTIIVLVDRTGERAMLPDRGACVELAGVPPEWLAGTGWLHLPAYSLTVEPLASTCIALVEQARREGAGVSVDASSVALLEAAGAGRVRDVLLVDVRPDILFANSDEAALLAVSDHALAPLVVVKDGPRPVRLQPGGAVAVPPVDGVVDTTGAGDAFAAGFLAARLGGAGNEGAARAGIALAATVLTTPGAAACV